MNKEYVQQYVKLEKAHWWFVVRQKFIQQFLNNNIPSQPLQVLNIGAAGGASTQWLSSLGKVISLETEPFFIDHLKEAGVEVVNASVVSMPFAENTFDLVCAFDVIEHVEDDTDAMKEMKRVCKPGGMICITVPALNILWSGHDIVNDHYRRYTKRSLVHIGDAFPALQKIDIRYFNSLLFIPILIVRKMSSLFSGDKKRERSDFEYYKTGAILNNIFKAVFSVEVWLLKFMRFPFGVSLIACWKKEGSNITQT